MKCTNKNCEVISLIPRTNCPVCGAYMEAIVHVDQNENKIIEESVNIDGTALVVSAEIEIEDES